MISRIVINHFFKMLIHFIDKKMEQGVHIVVVDKLTDTRGENLCGVTMPDLDPEDHYRVYVCRESNMVATLIHEFMHKMFPDAEEEFVRQMEIELTISFTTEQLRKLEEYLQ